MKRSLGAATLVLVTVICIVVGRALRPGQVSLDGSGFDHLRVVAFAVAAAVVALPVAWWAGRADRPATGVAIAAWGSCVVAGAARYASAPRPMLVVVLSLWLGAPALGLLTFARRISPRRVPTGTRREVTMVAAVGVTALLTAVVDSGVGLGATFPAIVDPPVSGAARIALAAHLAVLVTAVAVIAWRRRSGLFDARRDPVVWATALWLVAIMVERSTHLLPISTFRNLFRGTYEPWAMVLAVHLPLVTTVVLLTVLGWGYGVRPRYRRLPSGTVVLQSRDPVELVRDDLATWLGDPTLEVAFDGGDGQWITRDGPLPRAARYDRATTTITHGGRTIGMLDHDFALASAPEALATAAEFATVALEANQLLAVSEARLAEARRSSRRLLDADTTMRSELLAELESGPIRQLRECADQVRFGTRLDGVVEQLRSATAQIREISHGLFPPELIDGNLRSVLPDRPGVPQRSLPSAVQVTAFLLAADDPDSSFADRDTMLEVRRRLPISNPALLDRVTALGGSVRGTTVLLPIGEP